MYDSLKVDIKMKANDSHDFDCKVKIEGSIDDVRKTLRKLAKDF